MEDKELTTVFAACLIIAIPENNASNPAHQSVKSCVRYLCRASARLQISPSEREVLRQISLPCVSTPADTFLVLCTLLNCLDCIIFWNCYSWKKQNISDYNAAIYKVAIIKWWKFFEGCCILQWPSFILWVNEE